MSANMLVCFMNTALKKKKTKPHDHCDQCSYSAKAHSATTVSDRKKKWHVEGVKTNTAGGNSIVHLHVLIPERDE